MISLPKFRLVVPSEMVRVETPSGPRLSANVYVGFVVAVALDRKRLPVTLPEDVGLNPTVKLDVCAAASVSGTRNPAQLKACAAHRWPPEIVTLAPPVFFSCTDCEFVVPFATVPKLTLDGVVANVPGGSHSRSAHRILRARFPFVALLVNKT